MLLPAPVLNVRVTVLSSLNTALNPICISLQVNLQAHASRAFNLNLVSHYAIHKLLKDCAILETI
jgi:hypothetical protein